MDALVKLRSTNLLNSKLKEKIAARLPLLENAVALLEADSGFMYPPFYIEPVLVVTVSTDNVGGLGILYARTIPFETSQRTVAIVVQMSAPLVLFGLKTTVRAVLAHELLHYVDLVRRFLKMDIAAFQGGGSTSVFEDQYSDMERAIKASLVFKSRRVVREISKKIGEGMKDAKLDEKCRVNWLEKGLPVTRLSIGMNQTRLSMEAILNTKFDPKVVELVRRL